MKIINYAKYIDSEEKVASLRPAHRQYMSQLLAEGRLVAGSGQVGGAFASYTLSPWEIVKANPALIPVLQ
ncbi:MAG TPA: hypothetical protein VF070_00805 [Streptosporangiaceae bacterium]